MTAIMIKLSSKFYIKFSIYFLEKNSLINNQKIVLKMKTGWLGKKTGKN